MAAVDINTIRLVTPNVAVICACVPDIQLLLLFDNTQAY